MNADGFQLLARVNKGDDPDLVKLIDRCAHHARTKRQIEIIEFRKLAAQNKMTTETLTVHLLMRILGETF